MNLSFHPTNNVVLVLFNNLTRNSLHCACKSASGYIVGRLSLGFVPML